jgi:hypothetical protein
MSRRAIFAILSLLSALNVIALAINVSLPSKAAVGGMSSQDLMRDPDFTRAVKSIAQECAVNIDVAKLNFGQVGSVRALPSLLVAG